MTRRALFGLGFAASIVAVPELARASQDGQMTTIASYRARLEDIARTRRFALIDIRADWCAVCHRIERDVLSHPSLRRHLEAVPLVKVDVTAMDEENRELLGYLRASGPPTFFVVDTATGGEYGGTRSVGSFSRRDLIRRLHPFSRPARDR